MRSVRAWSICWAATAARTYRRSSRQSASALAVHTDPYPVTFSPLLIEWSRACPALAGSRSLPLICPADWVAEERAGVSLSSACLRQTHNLPCSKYQREIDGVQSAQIDLRFGDAAREILGLRVSAAPGDLTRKDKAAMEQ